MKVDTREPVFRIEPVGSIIEEQRNVGRLHLKYGKLGFRLVLKISNISIHVCMKGTIEKVLNFFLRFRMIKRNRSNTR